MVRLLKPHFAGVVALIVLLLLAMPVLANEAQGTMANVNPDDLEFAITDEGGNELNFRMLVTARVYINDEEHELADLQAGDDITVTFEVENQEMLATEIRCKRN
jgi:hypothetical protein